MMLQLVSPFPTSNFAAIWIAVPTFLFFMANCSYPMSNKAVRALGFFCLLLLVQNGAAYEFVVGGQKGWSVPSDPNNNPYNQWAEKSRFQTGDSLVFNYPSGKDSVLQVKSEDYANCNTDAPIAKFSDGHTVIKINQSGKHFFISGKKDNCLKNEKMVVIVLADRSNRNNTKTGNTTTASPPPSPSPATSEINPTPAPVSEPPPPNAASSILVSFAGSVSAFMASTLLLTL